MLNFDLQNHRPLREIVYEELKRQILIGEIAPGTRMMEVELADVMGVSRTPVREAIRKLEKEGLVTIEPRKGAYASNISIKDMVDVLEVRQGLEGMAAAIASGRITEEQKEALMNVIEKYRVAVDSENIEEILEGIKAHGLRGIKIHPDYQGVYFDDPRYVRILREAAKRDLLVVTHAGIDIGYPRDVHCTPNMVLKVLDELSGIIDNKLILAHMGGCDLPDEVLEKLCGKPVYFDTSFVLDRYTEKCREIINCHGADKILFATDSPWADQKHFIEIINSYGFSHKETQKIFSGNACKLFHL